jgi:hypothetical protein
VLVYFQIWSGVDYPFIRSLQFAALIFLLVVWVQVVLFILARFIKLAESVFA